MKADVIIGIDPDTVKSGVCYLEAVTRKIEASALTFFQLYDYLKYVKENKGEKSILVVVEAGWLNRISNYHTKADRKGQRISKNIGANHEVGKKTVEMCRQLDLEVVEQKPLKKCWKGRYGKITQDEINEILENLGTLPIIRVNQDVRDAILISIVYANLPIKIKAK